MAFLERLAIQAQYIKRLQNADKAYKLRAFEDTLRLFKLHVNLMTRWGRVSDVDVERVLLMFGVLHRN